MSRKVDRKKIEEKINSAKMNEVCEVNAPVFLHHPFEVQYRSNNHKEIESMKDK